MWRFSHERSECERSHEVKIPLRTSFEPYFIPREPNKHIKVMILRLEWYKRTKRTRLHFYTRLYADCACTFSPINTNLTRNHSHTSNAFKIKSHTSTTSKSGEGSHINCEEAGYVVSGGGDGGSGAESSGGK